MEIIGGSIRLWKYALNKYSAKQLSEEIDNLNMRITDVYSDMANAHFEAARDALLAVECSNAPESEMRAAIGHLREAFNILRQIVDKKITRHYLIFFKNEEYAVGNREALYQCLAYLSALISIIYSSLKERENALKWKEEASGSYLSFLENIEINPAALKRIDEKFVWENEYETSSLGEGEWGGYSTRSCNTGISEAGDRYLKDWKSDVHKEFICEIDRKNLEKRL